MKKIFYALGFMFLWCLSIFAQQKASLNTQAAAGACPANAGITTSTLVVAVDPNSGGVTLTITSNPGNTINFYASGDGGTSYVPLNATPSNGTTAATSSSSTGTWQANIAGYTRVCMLLLTWVSGSTNVSINLGSASARAGGGGGAGTVTNVSGTANQIDVATGTTTPVVSIDSALQLPGTMSQAQAGAASAPAFTQTGTPFSGTGTTSTPLFYQNGGTAPTTWSTAGTYYGVNAVSGFTGNFLDYHLNGGASLFSVNSSGAVVAPANITAAYRFSNSANTGFDSFGVGQVLLTLGGANEFGFGLSTAGELQETNIGLFDWSANGNLGGGNPDTGLSRKAAGVVAVGTGAQGNTSGSLQAGSYQTNDSNNFGANIIYSFSPCETAEAPTTLATGATTTQTGLSCLPANSIIDAVVARVTTTITAACTGWELGDGTTAARFTSNNTTLTAGTVSDAAHIGTFNNTGIASATTGIWQAAATKITITCAGGNPGAGAIRIGVFYHTWTAPTS